MSDASCHATRTCGETIAALCEDPSAPLTHQVFLVPGFLGFSSLGEQTYFTDVASQLCAPGWRITSTDTDVTTPIRARAQKLAQIVATQLVPGVEAVHFVGHSTGGLDVRALLAPDGGYLAGMRFDDGSCWAPTVEPGDDTAAGRLRRALAATRSLICLATPHRGSPIADIGVRLRVDRILLALGKGLERPEVSARAARGLGALLRRLPVGRGGGLYQALRDGLLQADPHEVVAYVAELGLGTGLLSDLTTQAREREPIRDREGVRYFDIVTGTPDPSYAARGRGITLMTDPIYRALRRLVGRGPPRYRWARENRDRLRARVDRDRSLDIGEFPLVDVDARGEVMPNDGIVPSYSQVHGELLAVVAADHLDAIGFYDHCIGEIDGRHGAPDPCPEGHRRAASWVISGSGYGNGRHRMVWTRAREAMDAAERGLASP